jgi:aromatic ring-opening dioxygenase LigB subunit
LKGRTTIGSCNRQGVLLHAMGNSAFHFLLLALVFSKFSSVQSKIVGAAVIPHGDFAYDPTLVHDRNGSLKVHKAALRAGKYVDSLEPDIIFLTTPHGVALSNNFAIYENTKGKGYAELGQDLHNKSFPTYKIYRSASMDPVESKSVVSSLRKMKRNVSALLSFADSEPQAFRWGEIIPLSFLSNSTLKRAKIVVLSHPLRRYNHSKEMVPELLDIGRVLFKHFDSLETKRVVFIASSDLAHTHLASGPYGFSKYAAPFDRNVGLWGSNPKQHANALLVDAANIEIYALSCGFPSLVMLHGLLMEDFTRFKPELLADEHPTYYGMMVSIY